MAPRRDERGRETRGVIAVICAIGTVYESVTGLHAAAIMYLICAVGTGQYHYRVWTFKAKRLWFI